MSEPRLRAGKVYRTEDFRSCTRNPTRLVARLVAQGRLRRLRKGLYYAPRRSAFGDVPPSGNEFLRALFRGRPYLVTGPTVWNGLGLGSTSVETVPLVYNTTRTGFVALGNRRFELRRVGFPKRPSPEFFVVDLLENCDRAGTRPERVREALRVSLRQGLFEPEELSKMAADYGTAATQALVEEALSPPQAVAV